MTSPDGENAVGVTVGRQDVPGRAGNPGGAPREPAPDDGVATGTVGVPMGPTTNPERHPDDLPPPEADGLAGIGGPDGPTHRRGGGLRWALLLAVVVLGVMAWVTLSGSSSDPDRLDNSILPPGGGNAGDTVGRKLPDLELATLDGGTVGLTSWEGDPLVVNFWASWCPPCLEEMPEFEQVARQREGEVTFVGLNVRENAATARQLADQTGVTYDLALDTDGAASRTFGVVNMPTTVFVAADGTIVGVHTGALDATTLNERIDSLLVESAALPPS
jgi:cytochrome c biogenesis protein CcmG/thiol:disulfide interchange protein DsbE